MHTVRSRCSTIARDHSENDFKPVWKLSLWRTWQIIRRNFLKIKMELRSSSMLLTTMVGRLLEDTADETPISTEADESPYAWVGEQSDLLFATMVGKLFDDPPGKAQYRESRLALKTKEEDVAITLQRRWEAACCLKQREKNCLRTDQIKRQYRKNSEKICLLHGWCFNYSKTRKIERQHRENTRALKTKE